jgi:hypothetical protein
MALSRILRGLFAGSARNRCPTSTAAERRVCVRGDRIKRFSRERADAYVIVTAMRTQCRRPNCRAE